jgi:hypothetical protein
MKQATYRHRSNAGRSVLGEDDWEDYFERLELRRGSGVSRTGKMRGTTCSASR